MERVFWQPYPPPPALAAPLPGRRPIPLVPLHSPGAALLPGRRPAPYLPLFIHFQRRAFILEIRVLKQLSVMPSFLAISAQVYP